MLRHNFMGIRKDEVIILLFRRPDILYAGLRIFRIITNKVINLGCSRIFAKFYKLYTNGLKPEHQTYGRWWPNSSSIDVVGRSVSVKEGYLALGACFLAAGSDEDDGGSASNKSKCGGSSVGTNVAALSLGMSLSECNVSISKIRRIHGFVACECIPIPVHVLT